MVGAGVVGGRVGGRVVVAQTEQWPYVAALQAKQKKKPKGSNRTKRFKRPGLRFRVCVFCPMTHSVKALASVPDPAWQHPASLHEHADVEAAGKVWRPQMILANVAWALDCRRLGRRRGRCGRRWTDTVDRVVGHAAVVAVICNGSKMRNIRPSMHHGHRSTAHVNACAVRHNERTAPRPREGDDASVHPHARNCMFCPR